ncbi:type 1 glutamine amidotransferase domain-containing protein [Streptantibioticus ferralitis]|uniref:Type 1 glutamine amidotransferase domain-containing protein n=1 Tax=Streptantibioticus ferralitis TaxID=236510 RepID=A0ABT5YWP8_9ACTN|nr:type 1 glutamine amidotransferase domain-containing protein [Streptantibioticus ferralitis]MDF2255985.1 type 1 glutamine amidotransferase domain-containing protein [Streptantibioticus ferralitis]
MSNILIVLSGADHWTLADGTKHPSGYWAEEFVVPHEKFTQAGHTVEVATPAGRRPTPDPLSFTPDVAGPDAAHYSEYVDSLSEMLGFPLKLADVDVAGYDAVVIPGGHGPMEDLADDRAMGRLLAAADAAGKIIASVCHGPAALLSATDSNGRWLFADRRLTCLTDEEETEFGTAAKAPWLLESRLRERGAQFEGGPVWAPNVVRDGHLISGQNPASSGAMADAVLTALG